MGTTCRGAVLCLVLLLLAGCKEELYSGLNEREANQMIAALMDAGIPVTKQAGADGIDLMVPDTRFAEAINLLNARGLPTATYESIGDVFRKEGIVSSPIEERARYIYALSQELSETIAEIDGVLSARVHVVLPETDMLGRDFQPSSASVFIRHAENASVSEFTAQIKNLVANSIEGLVYDNVSLVTIPAAGPVTEVSAPALEQVLGVWVHPGSVRRLQGMFGLAATGVLFAFVAAGAVAVGRGRGSRADMAEEV